MLKPSFIGEKNSTQPSPFKFTQLFVIHVPFGASHVSAVYALLFVKISWWHWGVSGSSSWCVLPQNYAAKTIFHRRWLWDRQARSREAHEQCEHQHPWCFYHLTHILPMCMDCQSDLSWSGLMYKIPHSTSQICASNLECPCWQHKTKYVSPGIMARSWLVTQVNLSGWSYPACKQRNRTL